MHAYLPVEAMDNEIGRLLAGLGPELQRTNVIFVADKQKVLGESTFLISVINGRLQPVVNAFVDRRDS